MVTPDYQRNKEQVMNLYAQFEDTCKKTGHDVNTSIAEQSKKIENEIFNLMVLGEAKSGKSTFINAFLGQEVVPMDALQCTSAIIKIRQGRDFSLTAKTAGGGIVKKQGREEIQEFLKANAAIDKEYSSIPVTTINNELLLRFKESKIPADVLDRFLEDELKDNFLGLDENDYKEQIRQYIREKKTHWDQIVTEIEIEYPFADSMKGITIIDSPGVGAGGNVGRITEEYINNANAIVFVKSLTGQALESISFLNLIRNVCPERNKESLFLVFTGKAVPQGLEFATLKERAIEIYKNDIDPQKILFVDSKVQLFLNHCMELGTPDAIDQYFEELDSQGNNFDTASARWGKAKGDIAKFKEIMLNTSSFKGVSEVMERFARVANYIQLIDFLENIEKELKRYKGIFEGTKKVAQENIDDPDALKEKIEKKKTEIQDTYNKLYAGVNEVQKDYTDNINGKGIITEEAKKKQREFEQELKPYYEIEKEKVTSETFMQLRKTCFDAIADAKVFRGELAKRIIDDCNKRLIAYTDDPDKIQAEAFEPNFTEADFVRLDEEAEKNSNIEKPVTVGSCFNKHMEKRIYPDLKEHVQGLARSISNILSTEIVPAMTNNVIGFANLCTEEYRKKLTEHKTELEQEYDKLKNLEADNDARIKAYQEIVEKMAKTESMLESISKAKGELQNYVDRK